MKKTITFTAWTAWSLLGGYRNIAANNYVNQFHKDKDQRELDDFTENYSNRLSENYFKERQLELKQKVESYNKPQLFVDNLFEFTVGSILYAIPFTGIYCVPAELYRLEVSLRNLENEKITDRYHLNWFNSKY